jgi:hypothetical protein
MKKYRVNLTQLKELVCTEYNKARYGNFLNEAAEPITRDAALHKIFNSNGAIFTVNFTKKDGTERIMNCRLGVKKHLKGGVLPYDAVEKGLIPVFDLQLGNYRVINKYTINALRIGGQSYVIAE